MSRNKSALQKKRLITIAVVAMLAMVAVIGLAWSTHSTRADVDCSGDWLKSTDEAGVLIPCTIQMMETPTVSGDTWAELATAQSLPNTWTDADYTPEPALPEEDYEKVAYPIPWDSDMGAFPSDLSGVTTRWRDGSVPSDDYLMWNELYVVTRPGNGASYAMNGMGINGTDMDGMVITTTTNPTIETMVGVAGDDGNKYQKVWTDPQADGALYITNITNPDYTNTDPNVTYPGLQSVVFFTTKSGQTGHFDMSTETWTFDIMSLPVPTPTAPPAYP